MPLESVINCVPFKNISDRAPCEKNQRDFIIRQQFSQKVDYTWAKVLMKPNLYSNTVKELFSYRTGRHNEYKLDKHNHRLNTQLLKPFWKPIKP